MPPPNNPIIADTAPLISLDACNQIELLRELYEPVMVPGEVERELGVGGSTGLKMGLTPSLRHWIRVDMVERKPKQPFLAALDDGEAEVIALALELGCPVVLLDEPIARQIAGTVGLRCIGSLGVLLQAKREGLIKAVKPAIDLMLGNGIWLSNDLVQAVLSAASEECKLPTSRR